MADIFKKNFLQKVVRKFWSIACSNLYIDLSQLLYQIQSHNPWGMACILFVPVGLDMNEEGNLHM